MIVYAGENGTSRSANKKTQYGNLAPRLGITYKLTDDGSTILRTGFGITYFPTPYAAGNLNHLNVPFVISQNVNHETNPLDFSRVRTIDNPFPPIVPVKPTTTAELIAANPRVAGHGYENETPYSEQWHLGIDRQLFGSMLLELEYAGSASKHMVLCYNPNEIQPGPGSEASRRLLQPIGGVTNMLQCDPRNRSTYHAGTLKLQKRFSDGLQFLVSYTWGKSLDYGSSAASGGGAVGNGQTITNMDAWHGPSGYDVRHRGVVSYVYELPFGTGRRYLSEAGGLVQGIVGGWQLSGITTMTTGRPFSVSLQAGVNNGAPSWPESDRVRQARRPYRRSVVQPGRLRRAGGEHLRQCRPRHSLRPWTHELRHLALEAFLDRRRLERRVPVGRVQPVKQSRLRLPEQRDRQPERGPHHEHDRRQPQHAVRVEAEFLGCRAAADAAALLTDGEPELAAHRRRRGAGLDDQEILAADQAVERQVDAVVGVPAGAEGGRLEERFGR